MSTALRVQVEIISPYVRSGNQDHTVKSPGFCHAMPTSCMPLSDTKFCDGDCAKLPINDILISGADVKIQDEIICDKSTDDLKDSVAWTEIKPMGDSDDEDMAAAVTPLNIEIKIPTSSIIGGQVSDSERPHYGSVGDITTLKTDLVIRDCYRWMWDIGYTGCDPLVFPSGILSTESADVDAPNRVDYPYDLIWMANHIKNLREMLSTVVVLVEEYESMTRRGITLRKSPFKENLEMQCIPLNLHYQFMVSRRHATKSDLPEISDFTTCGAMAAHGLGYKNGGLGHQEDSLGREKAAIESLLSQYYGQVSNRKSLHPSVPAQTLFHKIGAKVQSFESETVRVGLRRLFCVSQILSIAINTLLLKLNLVALGYIDAYFADRWIDQGFPLIFESLLSVSGKEKVMLEDTSRAIEVLRGYRVRFVGDEDISINPESKDHFGVPRIEMVGREVVIFVSPKFLHRLPSRFSSSVGEGGIVLSFVSFLFTLGIDIKQAMATTWENADGNLDFQVGINKKGFALLNEYCHRVMPIDQLTELLHPLVADFEATLRSTSKMNVDILHEVEKISVLLGGCRITFCKSGKDRTGMAVTLDQSRQLSEIFGLESSSDRVVKDANLMRVYGTRLMVADKNIGRPVFAINRLQLQFMPALYRPPASVLEDVFKASDSS